MGNYEHVATIVWNIATVVPLNIKESMHSTTFSMHLIGFLKGILNKMLQTLSWSSRLTSSVLPFQYEDPGTSPWCSKSILFA